MAHQAALGMAVGFTTRQLFRFSTLHFWETVHAVAREEQAAAARILQENINPVAPDIQVAKLETRTGEDTVLAEATFSWLIARSLITRRLAVRAVMEARVGQVLSDREERKEDAVATEEMVVTAA